MLETFLVLDRFLYLKEDLRTADVEIFNIFDETISPRNLALCGVKSGWRTFGLWLVINDRNDGLAGHFPKFAGIFMPLDGTNWKNWRKTARFFCCFVVFGFCNSFMQFIVNIVIRWNKVKFNKVSFALRRMAHHQSVSVCAEWPTICQMPKLVYSSKFGSLSWRSDVPVVNNLILAAQQCGNSAWWKSAASPRTLIVFRHDSVLSHNRCFRRINHCSGDYAFLALIQSINQSTMVMSNPEESATVRKDVSKRNFDDLLAVVGSSGRYQNIIAFLVILPAVLPSGFLSMTSVKTDATLWKSCWFKVVG